MKKLMVLVAAVALAIAGQAASVDWKLNVAGQGATWKEAGAYVMAFNGSDYDAVINLLTVTGSDNMATDLGKYSLANDTSVSQFAINNSRGTAAADAASANVTDNKMFWVVFTEGSMEAKSAIQWTAATDVSANKYEAGSPSAGTFTFTAVPNSGNIASSNVPEPTSGLLLLIGMAGLALKRKRA